MGEGDAAGKGRRGGEGGASGGTPVANRLRLPAVLRRKEGQGLCRL